MMVAEKSEATVTEIDMGVFGDIINHENSTRVLSALKTFLVTESISIEYLVLNFKGVARIGASTISMLISLDTYIKKDLGKNLSLAIKSPDPNVCYVLKITNIFSVIKIIKGESNINDKSTEKVLKIFQKL